MRRRALGPWGGCGRLCCHCAQRERWMDERGFVACELTLSLCRLSRDSRQISERVARSRTSSATRFRAVCQEPCASQCFKQRSAVSLAGEGVCADKPGTCQNPEDSVSNIRCPMSNVHCPMFNVPCFGGLRAVHQADRETSNKSMAPVRDGTPN